MPSPDPVPAASIDSRARFVRAFRLVALFALVFAAGAVFLVHESTAVFRIHVLIATFLGAFLSILMAGALMLLIFASNRSGHDEAVHHFMPEDDQ